MSLNLPLVARAATLSPFQVAGQTLMKPKFTIQHMLWATFAFGFVALAMSAAYRGNIIAMGLVFAPLVMIVTFAVLAAVYWPCYFVSRMLYRPIHTAAAANFSNSPSYDKNKYDKNKSANSPDVNSDQSADNAGSAGATE